MKRPGRLLGLLLALLALPLAGARAAGHGIRASDLWASPAISSVSVSPRGDWVVGIAQHGDIWGVLAQRRGQAVPVIAYSSGVPISWARWVGRDSLYIRLAARGQWKAALLKLRFEDGEILHDELDINRWGYLVDPLPDEDQIVLWASSILGDYKVSRGPAAALSVGPPWRESGVWVDGEFETVASLPNQVESWVTDRNHVVRAARTIEGDTKRRWVIRYREGPSSGWRRAWKSEDLEQDPIEPVGFTEDGKRLIVFAYGEHDTRGLYELDPESGELVREVFRRPSVDLTSVLFAYNRSDIIAVGYEEGGHRQYYYLREFQQKHLAGLDGLELGEALEVVSSSRDLRFLALRASGDRDPGTFYFFEKQEKKLTKLGRINDKLDPERLVPVDALQVVSADGTKLEALLAVPKRSDGKPPPLVVMPHGGPIGVRDRGYFDPLTQFLATAGLAVLRVNYRGSGGFGREFRKAGAKQWGRGIEDDIEAAVALVVDKGLVDPNRICIFGGSYGGYSALMSSILHPERYRCAVSLNGVADLPLLLAHDSRNSDLREIMVEIAGDPETEFDQMMEVSPVYRVAELRAPVMIIHGNRDGRVDLEHAYRLRAMMEVHEKPYAWMEIDKMGHSPSGSQWQDIARAVGWFLQCHLGEIDPPESRKWRGYTCQPGRNALPPEPEKPPKPRKPESDSG